MKNRKQNTYFGVTKIINKNLEGNIIKYQVRVRVDGVLRFIGSYDKEEDGAAAYDNEMIANGKLDKLNFPNAVAIAARVAASRSMSTAAAALATLAAESATGAATTTGATDSAAISAAIVVSDTAAATAAFNASVALAAVTTIGTLLTNAITTAMAAVAAADAAATLAADVAAGIGCLAVAPAISVIEKSSLLRGVTAVRNCSTGYYTGKWLAKITVPNTNGIRQSLGTYNSEQDAGIAYEVAHAILHPSAQTTAIVSEQMDQLSINNPPQGAEHETVRSLDKI
jgi:hypothetical protein